MIAIYNLFWKQIKMKPWQTRILKNTNTHFCIIASAEAVESHLDEIDTFAIIAQEQWHQNVLAIKLFWKEILF